MYLSGFLGPGSLTNVFRWKNDINSMYRLLMAISLDWDVPVRV